MSAKDKLLCILRFPHLSEKASFMKKYDVVVFNVNKTSTKLDIKYAVKRLYAVDVRVVRTVIVKGKIKKRGKKFGKRSHWKKAYVTLAHGQKIDFSEKKYSNIN